MAFAEFVDERFKPVKLNLPYVCVGMIADLVTHQVFHFNILMCIVIRRLRKCFAHHLPMRIGLCSAPQVLQLNLSSVAFVVQRFLFVGQACCSTANATDRVRLLISAVYHFYLNM